VAGDWLAVGLDPRPERLAAFPWRRPQPPTVEALVGELVGAGVARFVLAHGGTAPDLERVRSVVRSYDAEVLVAGGVRDLEGLRRVRDTGATGVILGEAILSGAIDLPAALEAAA
jgi:phosphoribosylformimino-5-aminoimidazole carboxamide ribotide isomerase